MRALTITTKSIGKASSEVKISNFNSSELYRCDFKLLDATKRADKFDSSTFQIILASESLSDHLEDITEKIGWDDEDALTQLFQEIEDEEIELANLGMNSYANSLIEFDNFAR